LSAAVGAQNAQFYLNGISTVIERQSNSINDVVDGLTFNLRGTFNVANDPGTNLAIAIEPDTVIAQNSIINFLNAYNAIRQFAVEQTQVGSDGTFAETAVLASNPTFLNTINSITQQITRDVAGLTDGDPSSLADLGITLITAPATDESPEISN